MNKLFSVQKIPILVGSLLRPRCPGYAGRFMQSISTAVVLGGTTITATVG